MKKLTFLRPKENINKNNSYDIFVGTTKLTELKNGEIKIVDIPDNLKNDNLSAKIKWCGSPEYALSNFSDNDIIRISGNDFLNKKAIWIIVLLPLIGSLTFGYGRENLAIKYMGIGILVTILLFTFYILVIARNKWLCLHKNAENNNI